MELYRKEYQLKNGENLVIRQPSGDDAKALVEYMKQVDTESPFLAREPGEFSTTVEKERELINNQWNSETSRWFIADYNDSIAGQCSVNLVRSVMRFRHRAELGISVKKDYWSLGIGGKLIQECIHWCKDHMVEQLELDVVGKNQKALQLYESFGFIQTGVKPNALKYEDGTYADEYFMVLTLR